LGLTTNFFPGIVCEPQRTKSFVLQVADEAEHGVRPAETEIPVGGIAGFPDVDGTAPGTADASGGSSLPYAAVAAGLAAFVAIVAGGWYARRRLSR
jgi:hypothetical protein